MWTKKQPLTERSELGLSQLLEKHELYIFLWQKNLVEFVVQKTFGEYKKTPQCWVAWGVFEGILIGD